MQILLLNTCLEGHICGGGGIVGGKASPRALVLVGPDWSGCEDCNYLDVIVIAVGVIAVVVGVVVRVVVVEKRTEFVDMVVVDMADFGRVAVDRAVVGTVVVDRSQGPLNVMGDTVVVVVVGMDKVDKVDMVDCP